MSAGRLLRSLGRAVVALALVATTVPLRAASAAESLPRGRIDLSVPGRSGGPLVLVARDGAWRGRFVIRNTGAEPLGVLRVAVLDDADDVRSASGLTAHLEGSPEGPATLAPGEVRDVAVAWSGEAIAKVRRAFGQVVVTSTDEARGEVAMGVVASAPTALGWVGDHALSLLVVLPLGVAIVAMLAGATGWIGAGGVRGVGVAASCAEWLLALWAYGRFAPGLGRGDGNDGFQLVERLVVVPGWGLEWYVGVDATSVLLVALASTLALVAVARDDGPSVRTQGALALLSAGLVGTFVALDLAFFLAAWQAAVFALLLLAREPRDTGAAPLARGFAARGAAGVVAMSAAFAALWRASGPSFLVDGTRAVHALSIPELARTSFTASAPLLGVPFVDAVWALLLVAVAAGPAATPLLGWAPDVLSAARPAAAVAIGGAVVTLAPYLLVRIALPDLADGARWSGPAIAVLGAGGMAEAAIRVLARRDPRSVVSQATVAVAGACLCAVGAARWMRPG